MSELSARIRLPAAKVIGAFLVGVALAIAPRPTYAQAQSEIQYTYDAAGNLIGVTRTSAAKPDLTVSNLSVGVITAVGNGSFSFPVTFQVNNIGNATAVATWYDRGYLSTSGVLHDTDQVLGGYNTRSTNLAAGASYTVNTTFTTSTSTAPGMWTLVVKADGGASPSGQYSPTGPNYVDEFNEFNNTQAITINLPANPKPDLTVSNLVPGTITENQNGSYSIAVTFKVNNIGSTAANPTWYDRGYLSANNVLHDTDQILGTFNTRSTSLASGASYSVSLTFATTTGTAAGNYYLIVKADGGNSSGQYSPTGPNYVAESDETNNTQAVAITLPVKPDLTVSNLVVGTITENQNGSYSIPVTYQVNNIGGSPAVATWYDRGYLSANAVLHDTDQILGSYNTRSTSLAAGANYTVSQSYTTTAATAAGNYYLIVKADGGSTSGQYAPTGPNIVAEADETNNTQAVAITLPVKPDLTVSNLVVGTITENQSGSYSIPVTYQVNNIGGSPAVATWYDRGYLSANAVLHDTDQILGSYNTRSTNLAAGAKYTVSQTYTTTAATAAGTYYLIVKADGGSTSGQYAPTGPNIVAEADETNNTQAVAITLPVKPDLTVSNLVVGTITENQNGSYNIPVTYQVNNVGGSPAVANWYDRGYLSANNVLHDSDQILAGNNYRTANLAAGANYTVSQTYTTTAATAAGNYYLIVKADGGAGTGQYSPTGANYVIEADETNNTQAVAITLPVKPDLTVSNLTVGTIVKNGNGSYSIPVSFQVNNIGGSPAVAGWYDRGYLSSNAVLHDTDQILTGNNYRTANLVAGSTYTVNLTFTTSTTTVAGSYYLIVKADGGAGTGQYSPTGANYVIEADETNNVASVSVVLP